MANIYLDHSATTPVLPEVAKAMAPYWSTEFGNPSSPHALGARAEKMLRRCRQLCGKLLQDTTAQIVYTSGGTEANNLALQGFARIQDQPGHMIITAVEHASVKETAAYLEALGWRVTVLPVDGQGRLTVGALEASLTSETRLVSIMWVNNELGTVNPIREIAATIQAFNAAHRSKVRLHVDAVQAVGRIAVHLNDLAIDMASFSGHKIGGPKGIGMLWLRQGMTVAPLQFGGSQELGLRPGTENLPGIVGLSKALQLAVQRQPNTEAELGQLKDQLWQGLQKIPGIHRTTPQDGAPHILHVCIPGVRGEVMVQALASKGVSVSTGSACSTKLSHSHVLDAIGVAQDLAAGALRFSLGPGLSPAVMDQAAKICIDAAAEVRPAYEGKE